jgi:hypothetical protein
VWDNLSGHMSPTALNDAAEEMVAVLIDVHDMDPTELYEAFSTHRPVSRALKQYIRDDSQVEDHAEEDYDDTDYD